MKAISEKPLEVIEKTKKHTIEPVDNNKASADQALPNDDNQIEQNMSSNTSPTTNAKTERNDNSKRSGLGAIKLGWHALWNYLKMRLSNTHHAISKNRIYYPIILPITYFILAIGLIKNFDNWFFDNTFFDILNTIVNFFGWMTTNTINLFQSVLSFLPSVISQGIDNIVSGVTSGPFHYIWWLCLPVMYFLGVRSRRTNSKVENVHSAPTLNETDSNKGYKSSGFATFIWLAFRICLLVSILGGVLYFIAHQLGYA